LGGEGALFLEGRCLLFLIEKNFLYLAVVSMKNSPDSSGWMFALAALFGSNVEMQGILEMPCISGTVLEKMQGILEMPSING